MSSDVQNLERNIAADRSMLERTLSQLSKALSPERISETVAREVHARGDNIGQTVAGAARANPAAAVLVGVGVAALLVGPKRPQREPAYDVRTNRVAHGLAKEDVLTGEFDRRVAAADAAETSEPLAPKMRAALNNGLAHLPEGARNRVIQAREATIVAQEKIDHQAAIAARKARSFHYRQPLSTAALAAGLGTIVAALLPPTRTEDHVMGAKRDALVQQAELKLRDEIAAATATGEAALREGIEASYDRIRHN
ncbi:MAG: DUF3618 domain-containing protein [Roseobacter sp.]